MVNIDNSNFGSRSKIIAPAYYEGFAKNVTMELYIDSVNGNDITGYNIIYWNNEYGLRADFTGTIDYVNNKITIFETNEVKGAGVFYGAIAENGNKIEGDWYRYSDNGTYKWMLSKSEQKTGKRQNFNLFVKELTTESPHQESFIRDHCNKKILYAIYDTDKYKYSFRTLESLISVITSEIKSYTPKIQKNKLIYFVRDLTVIMHFNLNHNNEWMLYKYEVTP